MAHHPQEAAEISAGCDALVCNFGAIADYEAMKSAALMATRLGHPIVIDPVGVSGSTYRRTKCIELIKKAGADCIRGNYSEIAALIKNDRTVVGVDAMQQQIDTQAMQEFARQNRLFLWASGETDILTDGERLWYCKNGDPLMARITGSGVCPRYFRSLSFNRKFAGKCGGVLCICRSGRGACGRKNSSGTGWNDDLSPTIYRHNFAYFITKRNIFKE